MLTIEAVATIDAEGTLTVRVPRRVPVGRHRVVVVIDEAAEITATRALPSLADFRANLGGAPLQGNAVLEAREAERDHREAGPIRPMDEQLDLIEVVGDGLVATDEAPAVTDAQRQVLDGRLHAMVREPDANLSWAEVRARVRGG